MVRMCSVHDESDEDSRDEININGQMIITDLARALVLLCLPATECTEPCLGPSSSDLVTPVAMPARPSLHLQSIHCTCLLCPPACNGSPLIRNRLGLLPHRPIWRSACPPPSLIPWGPERVRTISIPLTGQDLPRVSRPRGSTTSTDVLLLPCRDMSAPASPLVHPIPLGLHFDSSRCRRPLIGMGLHLALSLFLLLSSLSVSTMLSHKPPHLDEYLPAVVQNQHDPDEDGRQLQDGDLVPGGGHAAQAARGACELGAHGGEGVRLGVGGAFSMLAIVLLIVCAMGGQAADGGG